MTKNTDPTSTPFPLDFKDRRCETRVSQNRPITVTSFPNRDVSFPGWLTDISGHGLGLVLPWPIKVGRTVAVEWDDTVALGKVIHCTKEAGSRYHAGLRTD